MRKYRLLFIVLLLVGLFAFFEGFFLKWIILDSQYSVFLYETIHIHHWMLGIVLIAIASIGLFYERTQWRKRNLV